MSCGTSKIFRHDKYTEFELSEARFTLSHWLAGLSIIFGIPNDLPLSIEVDSFTADPYGVSSLD